MYEAKAEAKRIGAKIISEFPFISSVGVEVSDARAELGLFAVSPVAVDSDFSDNGVNAPILSELHGRGINGNGIGIAIIDTGIYPHLEFCMPQMRISAFVDFVAEKNYPYDDNGHGTSVAGIACGSGAFGKITGVAPASHIVALKAIDESGSGNVIGILKAMQWLYVNAKHLGVRVLNISLGSEPLGKNDPLVLGVTALTSIGVTVVASAGNSGPDGGTVKSPGVALNALTVGGAEKTDGKWYAAEFSSRGNDDQNKPDLIAPAVRITTAKSGGGYFEVSGTSIAAPFVAGYCALVLQQHNNYTPSAVKAAVLNSLTKLDCPQNVCGRGILYPF